MSGRTRVGSGAIFNVGATYRISILDLARRILAATGSESELQFVPYEEVYGLGIEDTLHREPSIERIGAAIGWRPTRELDAIIGITNGSMGLGDVAIQFAEEPPLYPSREAWEAEWLTPPPPQVR